MGERAQHDPAHDAEVAFLRDLAAGRPIRLGEAKSGEREGRRLSRQLGHATFIDGDWALTPAGRAWLAAHPATAPAADGGSRGL